MSELSRTIGARGLSIEPTLGAPSAALRLYSKFMVCSVLCLIFIGALVTSHDAGLSVPDWPTTYGQNMFLFPYDSWIGGIFYEHGHRLFASAIGALTIVLTLWITFSQTSRSVKVLAWSALCAVILQGLLGGVTVLLQLPDAVSVSHAVLGQTFFVLLIAIAYLLSAECSAAPRESAPRHVLRSALFVSVLVYIQLLVGALMRHAAAGLAVPDFPTMATSWTPIPNAETLVVLDEMRRGLGLSSVTYYQVYTHIAHRALGVVVCFAVLALALRVFSSCRNFPRLRSTAKLLLSLVVVQFTLGAATVLSLRAPYIASLHVLCGAMLLGVSVLAVLRSWPRRLV